MTLNDIAKLLLKVLRSQARPLLKNYDSFYTEADAQEIGDLVAST